MSDSGLPEDKSPDPFEADEKLESVDEDGTIDRDRGSGAADPLETHRDRSTGLPATQAILGPPS